MIHCLHLDCAQPENPDRHRFCQNCGAPLRLGDRYEAVYAVGANDNSRTFVGRDRTTLVQSQCLIKCFTPTGETTLQREADAERLRKDGAHLAIASRHPQIPALLETFERDEQQIWVQEFVMGPHLDQCLQAKMGPFDSAEVGNFLKNVLPILHHLHRNRLIHRDIKPANWRQPPNQTDWWLVDFGAIKPLTATRIAQPGTLIGSADYAAPEQLRGEATFASDIYSLGVVCLHLLTGLQPFDLFDGVNGVWHWRSIVPDVSLSLANLLDQMVQPALRDRLPDVETVMAHLDIAVPASPAASPSSRPHLWQPEQQLTVAKDITAAVILPSEGQVAMVTTDNIIELWSFPDGTQRHCLHPDQPSVQAIAAHPQRPLLVAGNRRGQLELWQRQASRWQRRTLGAIAAGISQLQFISAVQLLMADEAGTMYCWQWPGQTPTPWHRQGDPVTALALSHNGEWLASGDAQGQVKLWEVSTGSCLRTLSRHQGRITALAWLSNDAALVTAGWDVILRWRHPRTGGVEQQISAQGFLLPVRSLLPHPTQPVVISGSQDGNLQAWSFQPEHQTTQQAVGAIAQASQSHEPLIQLLPLPVNGHDSPQFLSLSRSGQAAIWSYPAD